MGGWKTNKVSPHTLGEDEAAGWSVVGPPHLQRYLSLSTSPSSSSPSSDRLATLLRQVSSLFTSPAFASLLASLTSLLPVAHTLSVRRFRPGLDYTLARGESASDENASAKLDVGLGLTPRCESEEDREKWEGGETGGWDIWLANEEGGDEATYGGGGGGAGGGSKKEKEEAEEEAAANGAGAFATPAPVTEASAAVGDGEAEAEEEAEEDDDAPLLALEPEWNRLHLVLRDPGVLAFVKYVSARAPASRWDVSGEWEVQGVAEEEDEE